VSALVFVTTLLLYCGECSAAPGEEAVVLDVDSAWYGKLIVTSGTTFGDIKCVRAGWELYCEAPNWTVSIFQRKEVIITKWPSRNWMAQGFDAFPNTIPPLKASEDRGKVTILGRSCKLFSRRDSSRSWTPFGLDAPTKKAQWFSTEPVLETKLDTVYWSADRLNRGASILLCGLFKEPEGPGIPIAVFRTEPGRRTAPSYATRSVKKVFTDRKEFEPPPGMKVLDKPSQILCPMSNDMMDALMGSGPKRAHK